jgi:Ca2+-binding RTX toxin-like protein
MRTPWRAALVATLILAAVGLTTPTSAGAAEGEPSLNAYIYVDQDNPCVDCEFTVTVTVSNYGTPYAALDRHLSFSLDGLIFVRSSTGCQLAADSVVDCGRFDLPPVNEIAHSIVVRSPVQGDATLSGLLDGGGGPDMPFSTLIRIGTPPDVTAPEVVIHSPQEGAVYARDEMAFADYGCSDELMDGLASCVGDVGMWEFLDTATAGERTFTVTATDHGGNQTVVVRHYTVTDDVNPSASVTSPEEGAVFARHEEVMADFGCSDDDHGSGVATCVGSVENGAPIDTSTSGEKTFVVTATDGGGNTHTVTTHYRVTDTVSPTIHVTMPAEGTTYPRGSALYFMLACEDDAGGVGVEYAFDCGGGLADDVVDTSRSGQFSQRLAARDRDGNFSPFVTVHWTIADPTAPTVEVTSPAEGATFHPGDEPIADFGCTDDPQGMGIESCEGDVASGAPLDLSFGEHTFTVTGTDGFGNDTVVTRHYSVTDVVDPTATVTAPAVGAVYERGDAVVADFGCADDLAGIGLDTCVADLEYGAAIDTTTSGRFTFTVTATDLDGNDHTVVRQYTVADHGRPSVSVRSPGQGWIIDHTQQLAADFTCADEEHGSGIESCVGDVANGAQVPIGLGEHEFTVTATDRLGNETEVVREYTVVDATPPTATLERPADDATFDRGEIVQADYGCRDVRGGSGIRSCAGDVPNGGAIDTSTSGDHSFRLVATDRYGNETSVVHDYSVTDTIDPTVTITAPAEGATIDQGTVLAANYGCADDLGGVGIDTCVGDADFGAAIGTAELGPHTFTVTATDLAGNSITEVHHYTVEAAPPADTTDPEVTLVAPAQAAAFTVGEEVVAGFTCADEVGGSGIDTCVGSVADGAAVDTATAGDFQFTVTATDHAGNETVVTHDYSVDEPAPVDTSPPTITIASPSDGASFTRGQMVNADFTCADGESGIDTCVGDVDDGAAIDTSTVGELDLTVTAVDLAGNQAVLTHHYTVVAPTCAGRAVTVMLALGDQATAGNDVILGTTGADTVNGGRGNDTICGLGGQDQINGGNGNDRVVAAGGNDTANGGAGNDALEGGAGSDALLGGPGNDTVTGGAQRDTCNGQAGAHDTQSGCEVRTGFP